jgi:hypothetical protein
MTIINISKTLKQSKPIEVSIKKLFSLLQLELDEDEKLGGNYYEFFDAKITPLKLYFDFEELVKKSDTNDEDEEKYYLKILNGLLKVFINTNENDWAITSDCRDYKDEYKLSFHFVCIKYKTNIKMFSEFINNFMKYVDFLPKIDCAVYRNGLSKWRTPYSQKDGDFKSLNLPKNYDDKKTFHNHIIQYTENLVELDYITEIISEIYTIKEKIPTIDMLSSIINENNFTIVSEKNEETVSFINVKGVCPFANKNHTNNNLLIIVNKKTITLKCHSTDCKNCFKILYNKKIEISYEKKDFCKKKFNSFSIPKDEKNNYEVVKDYFEFHYQYFRDSNSYQRIDYDYIMKYGYYKTKLVTICEKGLKDLKYKVENSGKMTYESFIEKYSEDYKRKEYLKMIFAPSSLKNRDFLARMNDKKYNLFKGFEYEKIECDLTDEDIENFELIKKYHLDFICGGDEKILNYLYSYVSQIIQDPDYLTHIILVLYSKEQGVGKSNFTKFISSIIGTDLCDFASLEQIIEKHSNSHVGKLLNVMEEVESNKLYKALNKIKDYSQRDEGLHNEKNKSITSINTYVRYIMCTNNVLPIEPDDRRYFVVNPIKCDDKELVMRVDELMKDEKMIFLFGNYFENYSINFKNRSDWNTNRPLSASYKSMIKYDSVYELLKNIYFKEIEYTQSFQKHGEILTISKKHFFELYKSETEKFSYLKTKFFEVLKSYDIIVLRKSKGFCCEINLKKISILLKEDFENHWNIV